MDWPLTDSPPIASNAFLALDPSISALVAQATVYRWNELTRHWYCSSSRSVKTRIHQSMHRNPNDRTARQRIDWGRPDVLFTPAYWRVQVEHWGHNLPPGAHRLGNSLLEETAACLLGGHGIPAEVALAAFRRLREWDLLRPRDVDGDAVLHALMTPLELGEGRAVRYRFARTKCQYLCALLSDWSRPPDCQHGRTLRDWLLRFRGIGLKTASWIVRNWCDSDDVAILDIHIYRAGVLARFFEPEDRIDRDYPRLEVQFLDFAQALGARPSVLDAIIWAQMKQAGELAHTAIARYHADIGQESERYQQGSRRCPEAEAATAAEEEGAEVALAASH